MLINPTSYRKPWTRGRAKASCSAPYIARFRQLSHERDRDRHEEGSISYQIAFDHTACTAKEVDTLATPPADPPFTVYQVGKPREERPVFWKYVISLCTGHDFLFSRFPGVALAAYACCRASPPFLPPPAWRESSCLGGGRQMDAEPSTPRPA